MNDRQPEAIYPLSPAQQGMLLYLVLAERSEAYFEQVFCDIEGSLDPDRLRLAWQAVVARHPALRTFFLWERRERPLQVVARQLEIPFVYEDWSDRDEARQNADFNALLAHDKEQGFDLARPPLLRFFLARLGEKRHRFLWSFSHLLLDGWSLSRLLGEAFDNHEKLGRGEELVKTPSPPFSRFIEWIDKQDKKAAEDFFRNHLRGIDGATPLPFDRHPGAAMGSRAARFGSTLYRQISLDAELVGRIDELARNRRLPPNLVWQAAWGSLLQLYSGEEQVVYGSVVSGRPPKLPEVEQIIGLFINALPVVWRAEPSLSLGEALDRLSRQMVEQREFEYCQLEEIQRWIGLAHDQVLFESLLIYENYPRQSRESGLRLHMGNMLEVTNHALVAYVLPKEDGAVVRLVFDSGRFDEADIERMLGHYTYLLRAMAERPQSRVGDLELTDAAARSRLLALGSGVERPWRRATLTALLAESARGFAERVALEQVGTSQKMTYAQLDAQAECLATELTKRGLRRGEKVLVALDRSPAMVVALLAIFKAGAAYVPVDPAYPAERIHFLLADSGAGRAITQERLREKFPEGIELVLLDEWLVDPLAPIFGAASPEPASSGELGDLAYVIYTSGSTGQPKGVEVEHAQLSHYTQDAREAYGIEAGQRLLQFASIGFDTSAEEIWPALLAGATLVLRSDEMIASPRHFLELLGEYRIELLNLPTAYWHEICAEIASSDTASAPPLPACLRAVIVGGEAVSTSRLETWVSHLEKEKSNIALFNTYGPTETTIVATRARLDDWRSGEIPIGHPIANARAYVVDRRGRLQPTGLPGELFIGGAGVARSYLNRPELSASVFLADPFRAGERVYKTGDLVAMREDGSLVFRGRIDQQVKIRGYRVEPGEIERTLLRHPRLRDATVLPKNQGGDLRLVAYLVASDPEVQPAALTLRQFLSESLPDYMIPSAFVFLPSLPLTPSGKIDRRALPSPERVAAHQEREYHAPRSPVEELIALLWSDLLNLPEISRDDDFFQLGGHSLLVGRLTSRLRKALKVELPLIAVFENSRLDRLAAKVQELLQPEPADRADEKKAVRQVELPPIERVSRDGFLPLSYPQERVWLIHQLNPDTIAYNFQATIWFEGPLEPKILARTLTEIVRRHEIFQVSFPAIDGQPGLRLHGPWEVELPVVDLRHLGPEAARAQADTMLAEQTAKAFDITRLPLIRWQLVRLEDDRWLFIQVEHHFVHDGWSLSVLMREMTTLYRAFAAGEPSPLPELEIQYPDFAAWQRKYISGAVVGGLALWWRQELDGMPAVLDLPLDHPRPEHPAMLGDSELFVLPGQLYQDLRRFGKEHGFTLYMTLLSAFCAFLQRYTGQDDFGVGAGVANRRQQAQMNLIGMIVNSVVMRCNLRGNPTFGELLLRIRRTAIESYEHQDMPFEQLVSELRPERHIGRNPLFQVMFSFHDAAMPKLDFGKGIRARGLVRSNRSAKLDLNVIVAPQAEQRVGQEIAAGDELQAPVIWEYNREIFDLATIRRMIRHFLSLAADAIRHPDKRISELSLMDPAEVAELVAASTVPAGSPRGRGLASLFEERADATPETIPAEHNGATLTYRELDSRAEALARKLRQEGVRPGSLVGICMPRGLDLIVGMLAILKAGGAYVPLDPSYPLARLALMMQETAMPLVIQGGGMAARLPPGTPQLDIGSLKTDAAVNERLRLAVDDDFPAYVIYTSGSTGKPKGAVVPQKAVARLVLGTDFYQAGPDDRIAQVANASFDAVTFEIWGALLCGGRVVVLDKEVWLSPAALAAAITTQGITAMFLTAAYFQQVVEEAPDLAPKLRRLIFGGERCEPEAARKALRAGARGLMNGYGPTECTTFALCHPVVELAENATSVPIGRPIAGTSAFVVDRHLSLCPVGVIGELCLGGEGLADGYFGRPALTAEKFIPHPFATLPGQRLYRTGDLARRLPDGTFDYLGRIDHQVKLRGFRIELGEIEAALATCPGVAAAVVLLREDHPGEKKLVAYAVPSQEAELSSAGLLEALRAKLPDFMLPAAVVLLETMPLTPNGKIDRRALPAPEQRNEAGARVAPETPSEIALAELWSELLHLAETEISVDDDFFSLGGHSLLATQLVSRIAARFGVRVSLSQVFEEPTLRGVAHLLDAEHPAAVSAPITTSSNPEMLLAEAENLDDESLDALLRTLQDQDKIQ